MILELLREIMGEKINIYMIVTIMVGIIMTSKLEMNDSNLKIKIPIIYTLFYLLAITNILSKKILIPLFIIYTFVFFEYIFIDKFTRKFIKKISFNILDYIYKMIFEYKIFHFLFSLYLIRREHIDEANLLIIVVAIIILTKRIWEKFDIRKVFPIGFIIVILITHILNNNNNILNILVIALSISTLLKGMLGIINNEFEAINFEQIFKKINDIMPIYNFKLDRKFKDFSNILILKEDRSYFNRKNSYNWISIEFLKYRLNRLYTNFLANKKNRIGKGLYQKLKFIKYILMRIIKEIKILIKEIKDIILNVWLKRKNIKRYLRGYSTIEMQLIRTLAIKDGYEHHIWQRKAYEIIYSKIYFESLNDYYKYNVYLNADKFKYYLIFLYIHVAPVFINGKTYKNIFDLYNKNTIDEITIEEFYIWTLGISNTPITNINKGYMAVYKMNVNKVNEIIEQLL